jgi:hypothetical protein
VKEGIGGFCCARAAGTTRISKLPMTAPRPNRKILIIIIASALK